MRGLLGSTTLGVDNDWFESSWRALTLRTSERFISGYQKCVAANLRFSGFVAKHMGDGVLV